MFLWVPGRHVFRSSAHGQEKRSREALKTWVCGNAEKNVRSRKVAGSMGLRQRLSRKVTRSMGFRTICCSKLPKTWAYNSYFSVLLVMTGAAKLLINQENLSSKSTSLPMKSENRAYNPCFPALGVVFLCLHRFFLLPSLFLINLWQSPSVIDDQVDHFWNRAPKHNKSWFQA